MRRRTTSPVQSLFSAIAERFAALTQVAYDGVFIYEAGTILNATHGAAALFGRDPQEINNCRMEELVTAESHLLLQHLSAANRVLYPALALRGDGTSIPIELSVQATLTLHGRQLKVIALRDATRDEEQDYLSDRTIARSRMTAQPVRLSSLAA